MNSQRTRYVLETADGKWATYDMRTGANLTSIPAWRYQWPSMTEAVLQLPHYEAALGVKLTVKLVT